MVVGDVFVEKKPGLLQVVFAVTDDEVAVLPIYRKVLVDWATSDAGARIDHTIALRSYPVDAVEGVWVRAVPAEAAVAQRYVFGEPTLLILPLLSEADAA